MFMCIYMCIYVCTQEFEITKRSTSCVKKSSSNEGDGDHNGFKARRVSAGVYSPFVPSPSTQQPTRSISPGVLHRHKSHTSKTQTQTQSQHKPFKVSSPHTYYTHMYIHSYIHIRLHIHIHIHTYISVHTHTHTHTHDAVPSHPPRAR